MDLYDVPEVVIGDAHLYGVRMIGESGRDKGRLADGVLGTAAFGDLLLTLDYPNKQVEIKNGELPKSAMSFRLVEGVPTVSIEIGKVKVDGHIDSGSDGGLMIPLKYKDQLPLAEPPRVIGHARTLFNEFDIYGAKITQTPRIGGMPVSVPMIEMHNLFGIGNIGSRVLRQYAVTIDNKNRRIRFEKPSQ